MKLIQATLILLLCGCAVTAFAASDAQQTFDRMKALTGAWEGKGSDGKSVSTTYQLTAGGTSLMSESSEDRMVTMFYLAGDRLLLTHYCGSGTQPRMQASVSPDGKTIAFEFVDGTNIPTMESGHMHRAVFTLTDADHYTEAWTWTENGKSTVVRVEMHRKP
ncbi:MAG TPA: hypothetical protein VLW84_06970 [Terriglobales bacterium]|nr:hypothetical protein [Terriglobales bacterium]